LLQGACVAFTDWVAGLTVAVIAWAIALAAIRVTERA
jgi:hypothetical protein